MLEFLKKMLAPRSVDGALVHLNRAIERVHACADLNDREASHYDDFFDHYSMKADEAHDMADMHRQEAARARRVASRLLEVIT